MQLAGKVSFSNQIRIIKARALQMHSQPDLVLRRLHWLTWTVVLILLLWQFLPWIERYMIGMTTEPRAITARGELNEFVNTT